MSGVNHREVGQRSLELHACWNKGDRKWGMDPCFPLSGSPPADLLLLIQFLESSPLDERSGYALDEYWGDLNRCPTLFPFLSFSPSLSPPPSSLFLSPPPPQRGPVKFRLRFQCLWMTILSLWSGFRAASFNIRDFLRVHKFAVHFWFSCIWNREAAG